MLKLSMIAVAALAASAPALAQNTTNPLHISSASATASRLAVTTDTDEQQLRRTAVHIAQVCNGRRLADRRECARIARIIDDARAEARIQQAATRP